MSSSVDERRSEVARWRAAMRDRQVSDACFRVFALVETMAPDAENWPTWSDILAAAKQVEIDDVELRRHLRTLVRCGYRGDVPDEYPGGMRS